jgi:hypothetical protein
MVGGLNRLEGVCRVRIRISMLVLAVAVLAVGGLGATSAVAAVGTVLPLQGVDSIVIDQAHGQVFVSGPSAAGTTSLVVANADGTAKTTIPHEQGARGMALAGNDLYVLRCNPNDTATPPTTGAVDVIDTTTLTRIDSFSVAITGGTDPRFTELCGMALAGGRLWIVAGDQPSGLSAVDVAAPHAQHDYVGSACGCPIDPASVWAAPGDPNMLLASVNTNPSQVGVIDVSKSTPTGTVFNITYAEQVVASDDGSTLFAESLDGIHAYSASDGSELGVYPSGPVNLNLSGEAVSGDGSLVVDGRLGGVLLFHGGSFTNPFKTIPIANGITTVALSGDGSDLYAATHDDILGAILYHIHDPVDALTEVRVFSGVPDQITPAAAGSTMSWARNGAADTGPYNEYVQVGSGRRVQVNHTGTQAFGGGMSGSTLVYQRVYKGQSDLRFYNVASATYPATPPGWNTASWEWRPTMSGTEVLFGRKTYIPSSHSWRQQIILGSLTTHQQTVIGTATATFAAEFPGQVNGNYAVWTACSTTSCHVQEYDIATQTKTAIPTQGTPFAYDASVSSTGTIYFAHSSAGCGTNVTLNKYPLGGPTAQLVAFPKGIDLGSTYVDDTSGTPTIYYSKSTCNTNGTLTHSDIYKVVD